ncbi:hypothetical protein FSP39_018290 [Pinctada imbricata]|uniref:RING-type domain-containing protein n=1 Tax=Pinctada imbricata TaxID=66713 RepID=A0AA88Y5W6_PINIB|nr:hypothetical protein FSP39_018290 [Pinctada imbricata]
MVYGSCQHRVCADCLYDENNRRPSMKACPTCQRDNAFPLLRPNIPEDTLAIQRCLGVRACTNKGCRMEFWEWELENHIRYIIIHVLTWLANLMGELTIYSFLEK